MSIRGRVDGQTAGPKLLKTRRTNCTPWPGESFRRVGIRFKSAVQRRADARIGHAVHSTGGVDILASLQTIACPKEQCRKNPRRGEAGLKSCLPLWQPRHPASKHGDSFRRRAYSPSGLPFIPHRECSRRLNDATDHVVEQRRQR